MIAHSFKCCWAIPVLITGLALLLIGCEATVPVKRPVEVIDDPFAKAEAYRQQGQFQKALEAYAAYLERYPQSGKVPLVLHRIAGTYTQMGEREKALSVYIKVTEEYPKYSDLPLVQYEIIRLHYLLAEYENSKNKALKWIEKYPNHSSRADVMVFLGENYKSLGDRPTAFSWWLKAKEAFVYDFQKKREVRHKLDELIKTSDLQDLEKMELYAIGSDYLPKIQRKIASIQLKRDLEERAKEEPFEEREDFFRYREDRSVKKKVVGCLLPLSGPYEIYGQEVLNGIQLGLGMFPGAGSGSDLELVIRDTKGEPERAVSGLRDIVYNEKVVAVIGPLASKTVDAVTERAQAMGVPMITLTQKEGVTKTGDMIFRNFLTPSREVDTLLEAAMGKMGLKRFAIIYPNNAYGNFYMNLFWDKLDSMGGEITAVESYDPEDTDFADQIKRMVGLYHPRPESIKLMLEELKAAEEMERDEDMEESEEKSADEEEPEPIIDFDAVFIPDNFERVAMIAPQLVYHDVSGVTLFGTSLWQSSKLIETAKDYVQGAVFSSGFFDESDDPDVMAFVEEYRNIYESDPGILAATGYDTIRLLKNVMERNMVLTRTNLKNELLNHVGFKGVTGRIYFDAEGDIAKAPLLLTVTGRRMALFQR